MKRILVIDDEIKIRKIYKDIFSKEGFEVLEAHNAADGTFKIISEYNIDLILLDINMPEVDGAMMREVIAEYEPKFKVIISSVYPIDEQRQAIPDAYDYHDKAQGIDILIGKVKKALISD